MALSAAAANWSQPLASALASGLGPASPQLLHPLEEGGRLNSTAQLVLEGIQRVEAALAAEEDPSGLLEDEERLLAEAELLEKLLASDQRRDFDGDYPIVVNSHDDDEHKQHHGQHHHEQPEEDVAVVEENEGQGGSHHDAHHEKHHGHHDTNSSHDGHDKHGGGHHEIPTVRYKDL
jgi:hypothetical protein